MSVLLNPNHFTPFNILPKMSNNTITVERKIQHISSTTIDLPYFYLHSGIFAVAIYSPEKAVHVCTSTGHEFIELRRFKEIPDDEERCSESVFIQAYSKAQLAIEEAFYTACTSVKPAAPFLTEKAV